MQQKVIETQPKTSAQVRERARARSLTKTWIDVAFCWVLYFFSSAFAADPLGYSVRTLGYSGISTTVDGDIKAIGRAGATVALPDSPHAIHDNPAGTVALGTGASMHLAIRSIGDGNIQNINSPIQSVSVGASIENYPWGFGLAYWAPRREGQTYTLPNATDRTLRISLEEIRFGVSRALFNSTLALGLGVTVSNASEILENYTGSASGFRFGAGLLLRLPKGILFGASANSDSTFPFASWNPDPGISGFFQSIHMPARYSLGLGWVPNRFFKAGLSFDYIGTSPDIALLRNQAERIGLTGSFHPKIGASYMAIDLRELDLVTSSGFYLETSRTAGQANRLHWTIGIEFKPWVLYFGWAYDLANDYRNNVFAFGIDVMKLMERLGAVPREYRPPMGGILPSINHLSDTNLPRFLVDDWSADPRSHRIKHKLEDISRELPSNLSESLENAPEELKSMGEGLTQDLKDVVSDIKERTKPKLKTKSNPKKQKKKKSSRP